MVMYRKLIIVALSFLAINLTYAQVEPDAATEDDEVENEMYKSSWKKNIHLGGSANFGAGLSSTYSNNSSLTLGISPSLGYFLAPWLDLGINTNVGTQIVSDRSIDAKNSLTQIGVGPYARIFIAGKFYLHFQKEWNTFTYKEKVNGSVNYMQKFKGNSNLAGVGYIISGSIAGNELFYYSQILVEINHKGILSPYVVENVRIPIVSQGISIPLFQGVGKARRNRKRNTED
jgi:hypothetical protein